MADQQPKARPDRIQKQTALKSTQQYLRILEIRDNSVILNDGTLRGVVLVSSINFALKSEDEQNAVIQGYIQFLNTLEFPLQIRHRLPSPQQKPDQSHT